MNIASGGEVLRPTPILLTNPTEEDSLDESAPELAPTDRAIAPLGFVWYLSGSANSTPFQMELW